MRSMSGPPLYSSVEGVRSRVNWLSSYLCPLSQLGANRADYVEFSSETEPRSFLQQGIGVRPLVQGR